MAGRKGTQFMTKREVRYRTGERCASQAFRLVGYRCAPDNTRGDCESLSFFFFFRRGRTRGSEGWV